MTASIDDLTDEIARTIRNWLWNAGIDGEMVAALAIREIPDIADALKAAETVARLRDAHRWETRLDSTWRSCTCGVLGCCVADVLGEAGR